MKIWYDKSSSKNQNFFLFVYNRFENGYATIFIEVWRFSFLFYTYKFIGKMKEGKRVHKQIKL